MTVHSIETGPPICRICAADLPPRAHKCLKCESFQDGEPCPECGLLLPPKARRCTNCKAFLDGRKCGSCGASMPAGARRCGECKAFQGARALIPGGEVVLALIVSIISVLSATLPSMYRAWNYRSDTYVRLLGVQPLATGAKNAPLVILALVGNDGGRPAVVRGARLSFASTIPLAPTPLNIVNSADKLVQPDKAVAIQLTIDHLERTGQENTQQILDALATGKATIEIDVEQTSRFGSRVSQRQFDSAEAALLTEWVATHVSAPASN
jgi:ribosomal protein L40E